MDYCYNEMCPFRKSRYRNENDCVCTTCPNRVYEKCDVIVSDHTLSSDEIQKWRITIRCEYNEM